MSHTHSTIQLLYGIPIINKRKCGVDLSFTKMEVVVKPESNKRYNAPHLNSMGICPRKA